MAGSDYTAVSDSLSHAEAVTNQRFSIDIPGDEIYESKASLNLAPGKASGSTDSGSPFSASFRIVEDDIQADDGSTGGSSGRSVD